MKVAIKISRCLLAAFLLFVFVVLVESYIRVLARKPIPVVLHGMVKAKISAYVQPDLLWIGEAWCVEIECDTPVSIDFDRDWTAVIPPGTNVIYSNHDSNNTARFSSKGWFKTPTVLTVQ